MKLKGIGKKLSGSDFEFEFELLVGTTVFGDCGILLSAYALNEQNMYIRSENIIVGRVIL